MTFRDLIDDAVNVADIPSSPHLKVVRVQPGLVYRVVCRSEKALVLQIHYHNRRTFPCVIAECPACKKAPPRRYAYVPVSNIAHGSEGHVFGLELPDAAFEHIRAEVYRDQKVEQRSMLGIEIEVHRSQRRLRSPLDITVGGRMENVSCFDLQKLFEALVRMWGLPKPMNDEPITTWFDRVRPMMF